MTKETINKEKEYYVLKLEKANTVKEMESAYWMLNFLDNFNWVK